SWNIKMLYGVIFDNFPIFNRHGQPYLLLASTLAFLGFLGLGLPSISTNPDSTLACFWVALCGMAMADVIADAMVVKRARQAGQRGGANLQTFCWVSLYVGSLIGRPASGSITGRSGSGSRTLMLYMYSSTAAVVFIAAIFLGDTTSTVKWSLKRPFIHIWKLINIVLLNLKVLLPMTWIVLRYAIVPDVSVAMAYWKLDVIDLGADTQSFIDAYADVFALLGLLIYARWFKAQA
ncbi:hypothetical protein HK102_006533, partial [Quaeritorhiza haematococci]